MDMLLCETKVIDKGNCTIGEYLEDVAVRSYDLRMAFDKHKRDTIVSEEDCTEVMRLLEEGHKTTRDVCIEKAGRWPSDCVRMGVGLTALAQDSAFEIGVVCRIVLYPTTKVNMPTCTDLMETTVATYPTIVNSSLDGTECVANMCDVYGQFDWRARPSNLLPAPTAEVPAKYEQEFVIPGCEFIDTFHFQPEQCSLRKDVHAQCGCIGDAMRWLRDRLSGQFDEYCIQPIETYLVFGRLAHELIRQDCVDYLCQMLAAFADRPECAGLDLPTKLECDSMQLHKVRGNCMWESDSGQVGVLECLDGTRCSLAEEGWPCCTDHYGRGRCPAEQPVMCQKLCSGTTEYCCEEFCEPRKCSPVLSPKVMYLPITTTTLMVTLPPGTAGDSEGPGLDVGKEMLTPGSALFVVFVILMLLCFLGLPICLLTGVYVIWQRLNEEPVPEPVLKMEEELDKNGAFWRIKPGPQDFDHEHKKPVVELYLHELPEERPLGLELLETKVIRVHSLGKRAGFEVGDIIVEIGGHVVNSFEELWDRIQIERDRCPVRLLVERNGDRAVPAAEVRALDADRAWRDAGGGPGVRNGSKDVKKSAKIGPAPLETAVGKEVLDLPRTADNHWSESATYTAAGPGLPSALVGWETWATPPRLSVGDRFDDVASSCPSSPPRSPARSVKVDNRDLSSTRFMKAFPVTAGAKLQASLKSKKDPATSDVRWVRDAWGRHVASVGGHLAPKTMPPR